MERLRNRFFDNLTEQHGFFAFLKIYFKKHFLRNIKEFRRNFWSSY